MRPIRFLPAPGLRIAPQQCLQGMCQEEQALPMQGGFLLSRSDLPGNLSHRSNNFPLQNKYPPSFLYCSEWNYYYRQSVKAEPWDKAVRRKLDDPAFEGFFLRHAISPPPEHFVDQNSPILLGHLRAPTDNAQQYWSGTVPLV